MQHKKQRANRKANWKDDAVVFVHLKKTSKRDAIAALFNAIWTSKKDSQDENDDIN